MKRMFYMENFKTEEAAREYIKRRRLRKYGLHYSECWKCWIVTHNIYLRGARV